MSARLHLHIDRTLCLKPLMDMYQQTTIMEPKRRTTTFETGEYWRRVVVSLLCHHPHFLHFRLCVTKSTALYLTKNTSGDSTRTCQRLGTQPRPKGLADDNLRTAITQCLRGLFPRLGSGFYIGVCEKGLWIIWRSMRLWNGKLQCGQKLLFNDDA